MCLSLWLLAWPNAVPSPTRVFLRVKCMAWFGLLDIAISIVYAAVTLNQLIHQVAEKVPNIGIGNQNLRLSLPVPELAPHRINALDAKNAFLGNHAQLRHVFREPAERAAGDRTKRRRRWW